VTFGHHLEQRGLHLRRRPVDLVGEDEVREHRTQLDVEGLTRRAVDARTDEIRRNQVGGELQADEGSADGVGEGLDRERLGEAGDALDEAMPFGEQTHEDAFDHAVLPDDDPLHLEERTLELLGRGVLGAGRRLVGHLDPPDRVRGV
jgi:hypothetical protein